MKYYKDRVKGIIHIGAYTGNDYEYYRNQGVTGNILFIEPVKKYYNILNQKIQQWKKFDKNVFCHNISISDYDGMVRIYINDETEELSSMERDLMYVDRWNRFEDVECMKFDTFIDKHRINLNDYDMINIDVSGYKSVPRILNGTKKYINKFKYIAYKKFMGFADMHVLIDQDDIYLNKKGFYVNKECYNNKRDDHPGESYFWINHKT